MEKDRDQHLSYSQISTYLQCPYLWGLKYIKGLQPEGQTPALILGKALHETLAMYTGWFAQSSGAGHNVEVLIGFWYVVNENVKLTPIPLNAQDFEKGQDWLRQITLSDDFNLRYVESIEERVTVDFGDGINIMAVLDRVDEITEGNFRIVDYKSRGFYTPSSIQENLQLRMYAAALWLMCRDQIKTLTVGIHVLETGDYTEAYLTETEISDTIKYVVSIGKRIYNDKQLMANPGQSCVKWGGCWGAFACREHHQTKLVAKDKEIDLVSASDGELMRWYTGIEYLRTRLQGAMKERLVSGTSELLFHNQRAYLKPAMKRSIDEAVLHGLFNDFSEYGFTPYRSMNLDMRKLQPLVKRVTSVIHEDGNLTEQEKELMDKHLEQQMKLLYTENIGGSRFTVEEIKEGG